jgi:hypothetical protein
MWEKHQNERSDWLGLDDDTILLALLDNVALLKPRVQFYLIENRQDFGVRLHLLQVFHAAALKWERLWQSKRHLLVGNADAFGQSFRIQLFHGFPLLKPSAKSSFNELLTSFSRFSGPPDGEWMRNRST